MLRLFSVVTFSLLCDLILRPRSVEKLLKLVQCIGLHGTTLPPHDAESERTIEHGQLGLGERARNLLRQPQSRDAGARSVRIFLDVVIDPRLAIAHENHVRQQR